MKRRMIVSISGAVLALLPLQATAANQAPTPEQAVALIESAQRPNRGGFDSATLPQVMAKLRVPGVSVAVVHDFKLVWSKQWGVADVATRVPVTGRTLFQAASMSKPVAAMLSLKAVQLGRFRLDQDINTILKSWKLPDHPYRGGAAVTPRMLMSHSSGMGDGFGFPGYAPGAPLPTMRQMLDGDKPSNVGPVRLTAPAMSVWRYSGGGTQVQQLALTDAMGQPFEQLAVQWLFDPVGMGRSSFAQPLPPALQADAAHAHNWMGTAMDAPWHVYPELAAAGLWTTAEDYARFMMEVQLALAGRSTRVLDQATARNMVTPVGVGSYTVGFEIRQIGQGWYFGHGGSNRGFRSEAIAHVAKGYGVVVMTNGDNGSDLATEIIARVSAAYSWDSLDKPAVR